MARATPKRRTPRERLTALIDLPENFDACDVADAVEKLQEHAVRVLSRLRDLVEDSLAANNYPQIVEIGENGWKRALERYLGVYAGFDPIAETIADLRIVCEDARKRGYLTRVRLSARDLEPIETAVPLPAERDGLYEHPGLTEAIRGVAKHLEAVIRRMHKLVKAASAPLGDASEVYWRKPLEFALSDQEPRSLGDTIGYILRHEDVDE